MEHIPIIDIHISLVYLLGSSGGAVELGDLGLEQGNDLGVLELLGNIEGCLAIVISISRVSTSGQQSINTLQVALLGGFYQW
jgi:hypothetical protein